MMLLLISAGVRIALRCDIYLTEELLPTFQSKKASRMGCKDDDNELNTHTPQYNAWDTIKQLKSNR